MNKFLTTTKVSVLAFLAFAMLSNQAVFAQEWVSDDVWNNYTPTYNGNTDYVDVSCVGCGSSWTSPNTSSSNTSGTGYSWVDNNTWNNYTPTYNGNTDYVDVSCVGCGSSWTSPNTSSWTSPNTSSWTSPNTSTWTNSNTSSSWYPVYTNPVYNSGNTGTVITQTNCPSNTTWNGTNCVSTVTGTVITNTSCPSNTVWNGTNCVQNVTGTVITNTNCPSNTTWNGTNCVSTITGTVITTTNCPSNTTWNGTNCVNTVTGTVITQTNCPSNTTWNGSNCVQNVTGTVITNTNCPWNTSWNGTNCVSTITPTVVTNTQCPSNTRFVNGVCQQIISAPVVTYQTCWDGSVIPANSVCQAQYKMCSNGASIPINQTCFVASTPIIAPTKIAFNNVVTSLATQVTNNQGRCNGIGLIAQGAPSTGWFEYGETANLGRTTAAANIGTSDTAPFSNLLTNLKPSTKYYCRAVMQNKYGVVKGEVVAFTTKAKAATYVKHTPAVPVKKSVAKKTETKKEVVCSDGSTISVKNQSAATLLNDGQKLIALSIEKTEGKLASEGVVKYKVTFKNNTDTRLSDVVIKVKLPAEIRLMESNSGMYDAVTQTLTLNQSALDPYTEGVITLSGIVAKDAALGKTIVTNAYVAYTVPGTNAQDEVTAYVVGSVVPVGNIGSADTGAKKVIGASQDGKGFLPNSLIEWLALLAILFIIFILGRSIHASYKNEGSAHH